MISFRVETAEEAATIRKYFHKYIYSCSEQSFNIREEQMPKPVKEIAIVDDGSTPWAQYWYLDDKGSSHVEPMINDSWIMIRDQIAEAQKIMETQ